LCQGIGCPVDLPSALAQFEYAAKQGHAKAALCAANLLYDSLGEDTDNVSSNGSSSGNGYAAVLMEGRANNQGATAATLAAAAAAQLSARRDPGATPTRSRRGRHGGGVSALSVGWTGGPSLGLSTASRRDRDLRRVASLYRQAAEAGLSSGMNSLGLLLEDGRGFADGKPDPEVSIDTTHIVATV
jgi:TPR repeat protein